MYRHNKKYQQLRARVAQSLAARERKRLSQVNEEGIIPLLPELRKRIEITSFDTGEKQTITFELFHPPIRVGFASLRVAYLACPASEASVLGTGRTNT